METRKHEQLFLVLVPHRDTRAFLRKYSADIIKTGFKDGCLFPRIAPLAAISQPFTKDELKQCASSIRETIVSDKNGGGRILTKKASIAEFPANQYKTFLFGPQLELEFSQNTLCESSVKKIVKFYPMPVIGVFLINSCESAIASFQPPQELSFRTAAVANMYYQQIDTGMIKTHGFKWKIGELSWLPKDLTKL